MLMIEPRVVNKSWVCSPISFKQMCFWCAFFNSHLTTHHSNIDVCLSNQIRPSYLISKIWSLVLAFSNRCVYFQEHRQRLCSRSSRPSSARSSAWIMRWRHINIRPLCWNSLDVADNQYTEVHAWMHISTHGPVSQWVYSVLFSFILMNKFSVFLRILWSKGRTGFISLFSQVISLNWISPLNHSQPLAEPS
jgi:hypothetical protein